MLLLVVLLSLLESRVERRMQCYPSSISCIQAKIFLLWSFWRCFVCLPLTPQSVCCSEAFAQNKPPHFCWLNLRAMSADFPNIAKLCGPYDRTPQGPEYATLCLLTPLQLSWSQRKSWGHCLYLSSIPALTNREQCYSKQCLEERELRHSGKSMDRPLLNSRVGY